MKSMVFFFTTVACSLIGHGQTVYAQDRSLPDRFANCGSFKAPKESAGVYFSSDCKVAFVMPSQTGVMKASSVIPSANTDFCAIRDAYIRIVEQESKSILDSIANNNVEAPLDEICGMVSPRAARISAAISRVELDLTAQDARISRLELQRASCIQNNDPCTGVYASIEAAYTLKFSLEHQRLSNQKKLTDLKFRFPTCSPEPLPTERTEDNNLEDFSRRLSILSEDYYLKWQRFQEYEGDTVNVLITLDHMGVVNEAQRSNPGFTVLPAPLELAISVSIRDANGLVNEQTNVKRSSLPLMKAPNEFFPNGDDSDSAQISTRVFGPSASGQIVLSLDASCKARSNGMDHRFLPGYLNANVIYKLPTRFSVKVSAEANFVELFSRIAKQTTNGGFFRTSSSSSVINSLRSDEVVKVTLEDDGMLSSEQRLELVNSVKDRIIQRGIDLISVEYLPDAPTIGIGPPNENGSEVAAKGIRENCYSQWCQVAAVILDVGNAIFGGTDAIQEFVRERDISIEELTTIDAVYYKYGSLGLIVE